MKTTIILFLSVTVVAAVLLAATPGSASDVTKCSTSAYVIDNDPNGLNVRKEPKGAVVMAIPRDTMLKLYASQGGWVQVGDLEYETNNGFVTKQGRQGWVYANMLATSVRKYSEETKLFLYSKATKQSEKVIEVMEVEKQLKVVGCDGAWLKLEYKGKTGYLEPEMNCPNPYTTCP